MAKIVPGPLVGEIRNKVGAQVFSRNAYGPYTKSLPSGAYFETPARLTATDRLTAATLAWNNDLTDSQRDAWENYAHAIDKKLRVCGRRGLTGRPTFISAFMNLDNIGEATLEDPPDQPLAGAVTALELAVNTDTETFALDGEVPPDTPTQGLVILATPAVHLSRNYIWPDLRQITALAPGWAFPLDLWADWRAKFDLPGETLAYFIVARPIAADTGLAGVPQLVRTVDQGTGGEMPSITVVLTDAEIKALPSTPKTIVAGVAGKIILPVLMFLQVDASAGAYTNITAGVNNFIRGKVDTDMTARAVNSVMLGGAGKTCTMLPSIQELDTIAPTAQRLYGVQKVPTAQVNQPMTLASDNSAGDFTGGNAANTMTVTVYYQLVTAI